MEREREREREGQREGRRERERDRCRLSLPSMAATIVAILYILGIAECFLLAVYYMYIITAIVLRSTVLHSFRLPSFFWNGFLKLYTCKTSGGLISQQHAIIHIAVLYRSLLSSTASQKQTHRSDSSLT